MVNKAHHFNSFRECCLSLFASMAIFSVCKNRIVFNCVELHFLLLLVTFYIDFEVTAVPFGGFVPVVKFM